MFFNTLTNCILYLCPSLQKIVISSICFNVICNCRKALLLLKKKRCQDQLLDKTEKQISNLELMVRSVIFVASLLHIFKFIQCDV